MKSATFPACPLTDCPGTFVRRTSKRGRPYRRCDTCGAFDGARFLTPEEKMRAAADRAAKRARRDAAEQRAVEREQERQAGLEVPQLPVEGWSAEEWFPGYDAREKQLRLIL